MMDDCSTELSGSHTSDELPCMEANADPQVANLASKLKNDFLQNSDSDNSLTDFHLLPQISLESQELIFPDVMANDCDEVGIKKRDVFKEAENSVHSFLVKAENPPQSSDVEAGNSRQVFGVGAGYSELVETFTDEQSKFAKNKKELDKIDGMVSVSNILDIPQNPVEVTAAIQGDDSSEDSFHLASTDVHDTRNSAADKELFGVAMGTVGDIDMSFSVSSDSFPFQGDDISTDDSELVRRYIVNNDSRPENAHNEGDTGEIQHDLAETSQQELNLRRRSQRKRLHSFTMSSSSSDEENDEVLSSDSSVSNKSSAKISKQDLEGDTPVKVMPKDPWNQWMDLSQREIGFLNRKAGNVSFQNRAGGSINFVQRLCLFGKHEQHSGCVNALNFNESGTLIASGSDDLQIVIWDWMKRKPFIIFGSGHRSNVFQAKFMPYTGDCHIVSCARDGQVRLAQLSLTGSCKNSKKLVQHKGAAHKLALLQDSSHLFYSCGEDGVTYHIDLRQEKPTKTFVTKENNRRIPLYSIHANPFNSVEHCVAGRDQFIRIYDARKIDESNAESSIVKKFCPHHLVNGDVKAHITCAVYNYNGTEILSSYNDENIYLFDNMHSDGAEFIHRYEGHRNSATVKGVNFYGPKSEYIVSGSDCGNVFFWERKTEAVVNYFHADENGVINVLEPHPHIPMLATSGLDNDVKLWMPTANEPSDLKNLQKVIKKNKREREDESSAPDIIDSQLLWFLMHSLRRRRRQNQDDNEDDVVTSSDDTDSDSNADQPAADDGDSDGGDSAGRSVQCTTS